MPGNQRIANKQDLVEFFRRSATPTNRLRIGIEVERSAVYEKDLHPVSYLGKNGYLDILQKLVHEAGWSILRTDEKGYITALRRGESEIHIEGDGRLELASKARKKMENLYQEYRMHENEIQELGKQMDIRWIPMGLQPLSSLKSIKLAPMQRTKTLLKTVLPNNPLAMEYTKKVNGLHVNFGYTSEEDAAEKFRTLYCVSPIIMAIFSNSPLRAGRFSGYMSYARKISYEQAPERTRAQRIFFEKDFSFEHWAQYLMSLPMTYIERKGNIIPMIQMTFGDFMEKGFGRLHAKQCDLLLHLKSLWNEVRLKSHMEFRNIEALPPSLIPSAPALIRGLTRKPEMMQAVRELTSAWTFEDHLQVRENVYKHALQAEVPGGKKILPLAKELLEIASESLKDIYQKGKSRTDLSRMLWPIKEYVFVREQSPAEYVMEMWNGPWHKNPYKLLDWASS